MANTVDNLITNYILNDRYTPALRQIAAQTASTTPALTGLTGGVSGLTAALGLSTTAATVFAAVLLGLAGALTTVAATGAASVAFTYKLGTAALKQAADMEILRATLAALRGSTDSAREGFEFLERFATQSVFEFTNLAEAGVQLEAFGLNMRRILPLISQIGAAFGAKPEQLLQLADAFGRIAAGQSVEAMQQLRRFGISIGALKAEGVAVSGTGQILSSADQTFAAIERIATRRFGSINESMADTIAVSISNLMDGVNQTLTQIGDALMPVIKPMLNALKNFMQFMSAGGAKLLSDSMVRAFTTVSNLLGGEQGIVKIASWIVAIFSTLPDIFAAAAIIVTDILTRISRVFGWLISALRNLSDLFGGSPLINLIDTISRRQQQLFDQFLTSGSTDANGTTTTPGGFFRSENPLETEYAKQTAENTKQIADEMKLQRLALGGGQLAAQGLSPITRRSLPAGRVAVGGVQSFEQFVQRVFDEQRRRLR